LCDRAIWLDRGRMMLDGATRGVVEQYLAEQHAADRTGTGDSVIVKTGASAASAGDSIAKRQSTPMNAAEAIPRDVIDARTKLLRSGGTHNRVEIFEFDPDQVGSEFGAGAARITDVRIVDEKGETCRLMMGGEAVSLVIEANTTVPLDTPIFGFYVKDRLGQRLFGDNSYLTYHEHPVRAEAGARLQASFRFRMPVLPSGDYSIDVALASGSQDDHTQQHWIHDALAFSAAESTMRHGLVGVPMHSIEILQSRS
ncbi:MAG: Wzt carbohydrate-binding domain-containing protein, partial [Rhodanobacter sp.]